MNKRVYLALRKLAADPTMDYNSQGPELLVHPLDTPAEQPKARTIPPKEEVNRGVNNAVKTGAERGVRWLDRTEGNAKRWVNHRLDSGEGWLADKRNIAAEWLARRKAETIAAGKDAAVGADNLAADKLGDSRWNMTKQQAKRKLDWLNNSEEGQRIKQQVLDRMFNSDVGRGVKKGYNFATDKFNGAKSTYNRGVDLYREGRRRINNFSWRNLFK